MSNKIFISAGHGNADPGAVANGTTEATIAVEVRNLVAQQLSAMGVSFEADGDGSLNLPLPRAIELAKACGPVRVEFHLNAGPPTAKGVECLSGVAQKALAQALAAAVAGVLGNPLRGDKGWKAESESARGRLGFLRQAAGVIVELFFITNAAELDTYRAHKEELAAAIANVLVAHNAKGAK